MEAKLPRIAEADRTPLVKALLAVIASQTGELREKRTLEDENQKLKDAKQKLEDEKQRLEDEKQKLEDKKQRLEDEKRRLEEENSRLRRRLEQYEPEIRYENKRRHPHRRHKNSSGRQATEVKVAMAQRTEDVYPGGVYHADCHLVRERAVWRLEDGKAILIGYRIFAGPGGREGHIPGVTPRCEYGIEVVWLARI
jgi:hypothetical protein